jgi:hypothetical protein
MDKNHTHIKMSEKKSLQILHTECFELLKLRETSQHHDALHLILADAQCKLNTNCNIAP